jgi:Tfp pilus assembly protein PilO
MKKKKAPRPNNIVIVSILIGVVTVSIGIAGIYVPFSRKTRELREETLREREKNVLMGRIRALDKHIAVYNKRVPDPERGISWLLSEVSNMAAAEHIEISYMKPGVPEDKGLYTRLYIVMDTLSSYGQLGRFIARVESHEKFFRIEDLTIKRCDSKEGFDRQTSKFKPFDVTAHIVISTATFKE